MRTNPSWIRVAFVVGVTMAAGACAQQLERPPASDRTIGPTGALECAAGHSPNPAELDIGPPGNSIAITVPNAGGTSSRRHALVVPQNAVATGLIRFSLEHAPETYVSVRAHHHGDPATEFVPNLTLRLSYAGCTVQHADTVRLKMFVRENGTWRAVNSTHDPVARTVESRRVKLSQYALGTG